MRKFKPLIPHEDDLKHATSHGHVKIPKSTVRNSSDPDALRKEISEQYTRLVQEYPHLNFGIIVDGLTDDITISWVPVQANPRDMI